MFQNILSGVQLWAEQPEFLPHWSAQWRDRYGRWLEVEEREERRRMSLNCQYSWVYPPPSPWVGPFSSVRRSRSPIRRVRFELEEEGDSMTEVETDGETGWDTSPIQILKNDIKFN